MYGLFEILRLNRANCSAPTEMNDDRPQLNSHISANQDHVEEKHNNQHVGRSAAEPVLPVILMYLGY